MLLPEHCFKTTFHWNLDSSVTAVASQSPAHSGCQPLSKIYHLYGALSRIWSEGIALLSILDHSQTVNLTHPLSIVLVVACCLRPASKLLWFLILIPHDFCQTDGKNKIVLIPNQPCISLTLEAITLDLATITKYIKVDEINIALLNKDPMAMLEYSALVVMATMNSDWR